MGEGNHLNGGNAARFNFNRVWYVVGGTITVLLAGLVLMQTFRAQPGQAAAEPSGKAAPPKRPDVARVGKEAISYDMVAQECYNRYGKEVLEDLINRMIIQQACEQQGIVVSDEEVTAEISRICKRFNLELDQWYAMLEKERGVTRLQYRQSVIFPMLALKKLAGEQVDITEEELNRAFVRNYGPRVKCKLILLDNVRRARECWDKCVKDPENFEKFAQEYSVDTNSRSLGGAIPPIPRYSGNDAVETAAFKLKDGEVSGLIEVSTGKYAILKCEGRTEQIVKDISEVQDSLYEELMEQKTQQSIAKVFTKLKENTQVDNYLTQTSTGPNRPFTQSGIQQTSGQKSAATPQAAAPGSTRIGNPGATSVKR